MQKQLVRINREAYIGLQTIKKTNVSPIMEYDAVLAMAEAMGLYETADWMKANRMLYADGIFNGFEII